MGPHAMLPPMLNIIGVCAVAACRGLVAEPPFVTPPDKHGPARCDYFVAGGAGFMLAAAFGRC